MFVLNSRKLEKGIHSVSVSNAYEHRISYSEGPPRDLLALNWFIRYVDVAFFLLVLVSVSEFNLGHLY